MEKILITGTAGFIGYHTAKKFLAEGYEVVGLDNINDYYDVKLKYSRLTDCGIHVDSLVDYRIKGFEEWNQTPFDSAPFDSAPFDSAPFDSAQGDTQDKASRDRGRKKNTNVRLSDSRSLHPATIKTIQEASPFKYGSLYQSSTHKNYRFIRLALEDYHSLKELFEKEKFDRVVHLAAQAGVRYSLTNPFTYMDCNINGHLNIMEACRHNKVKHLVYASSSSVYGSNTKMPLSTSDNVDHPISLYAATKKANELMSHTYSHLYGLPTTGLRFFTVYGPFGRPDMALFLFTKAMLADKPIDVYNHGEMWRDFTYVEDIVEGVYRVTLRVPLDFARGDTAQGDAAQGDSSRDDSPDGHSARGDAARGDHPGSKEESIQNSKLSRKLSGSKCRPTDEHPRPSDGTQNSALYKVYNIGNSSPVKLLDFIKAIEDKLGKKAQMNMMDMQPGDVPKTWADTTDLEADVGYKPDTSVEEGVGRFIEWYREYYNK